MSAAPQGLSEAYLRREVVQPPIGGSPRNAQQQQGTNLIDITRATILLERSQQRVRREIEQLGMSYVFADEAVTRFLMEHRALPSVLSEALEPLRKFFGEDKVLRLEVSKDEDELRTIYAVVRWAGSAKDAAAAINRFDEEWWLDHMTPAVSNLSFTCDFA